MKSMLISAMPGELDPAKRLAEALRVDLSAVDIGMFPDGETKLRVPDVGSTTLLYCSLHNPNSKIMPLILAASALRDAGAAHIILVAPYLCYMRQDIAFRDGEPVSQRVFAALISPWIDHLVTVEPHLHRTKSISAAYPTIGATNISAAPALAGLLREGSKGSDLLLVGPDEEARRWTASVAEAAGAPYALLSKTRSGDKDVAVRLDAAVSIEGRFIVLVDDIVSSGATLAAAAALLKSRGARRVEALVVHALCGDEDLAALRSAGVERVRSLDTAPHATNAASIAPLLAPAIAGLLKGTAPS